MDVTKTTIATGEKIVTKSNATKEYFFSLIKRAKGKYGLKSKDNLLGVRWANAHKLEFSCNGYLFKYEFLPEFDFFDK